MMVQLSTEQRVFVATPNVTAVENNLESYVQDEIQFH